MQIDIKKVRKNLSSFCIKPKFSPDDLEILHHFSPIKWYNLTKYLIY
jgi:hypothetical protein